MGADGRKVENFCNKNWYDHSDQDIYCQEHPSDWLHDLNVVPDVVPDGTASGSVVECNIYLWDVEYGRQ